MCSNCYSYDKLSIYCFECQKSYCENCYIENCMIKYVSDDETDGGGIIFFGIKCPDCETYTMTPFSNISSKLYFRIFTNKYNKKISKLDCKHLIHKEKDKIKIEIKTEFRKIFHNIINQYKNNNRKTIKITELEDFVHDINL